jgi:RNA polymerase sigma-70 factor (sigma-E family)
MNGAPARQPFGAGVHQVGVTDEQEQEYLAYVRGRLPWLRRVAYLLTHDWHRADDVVQVTITRLYTGWRRASTADNVDGYVRRMLINEFLGERRSRWGTRLVLSPRTPDVEAESPELATRLTVRAALALLPPRQRAVLVLRYYADLSIAETAAALNCSTGNVKSLSSNGLTALRRLLADLLPSSAEGE